MLKSFPDFHNPPFNWDAIPSSFNHENVDSQWEHYRPLFEQCGYTLRTGFCNVPPDHLKLPPPDDPFRPKPEENYVALPVGPGSCAARLTQNSVRSGYDMSSREVFFKVLFGSELDVVLYLAQRHDDGRDPRDHTIPILEVIRTPSCTFAITPYWGNIAIPFYALGEPVEFMRQCLEGLVYMHENRIAHLDISTSNIVMSCGGKIPYHPDGVKPFRSLFNVQYAFIDFGLSRRFGARVAHDDVAIVCSGGTVPFVPPESFERKPYNPFQADIYSLGAIMLERLHFDEKHLSRVPRLLEEHMPGFLDLLKRMTDELPSERPSATEAYGEAIRLQNCVDQSILLLAEQPELEDFDYEAWLMSRTGPVAQLEENEIESKPAGVRRVQYLHTEVLEDPQAA